MNAAVTRLARAVGLAVWELPQNVLGAALLAVAAASGRVQGVSREQGRMFVHAGGIGVSLGWFVFWFERDHRYFAADSLMKMHEHGHSFQSRLLGPLYLPLVGIPSTLRLGYAVAYRELAGRRWSGYFDGYPESWADRLGGVDRRSRAPSGARSATMPP